MPIAESRSCVKSGMYRSRKNTIVSVKIAHGLYSFEERGGGVRGADAVVYGYQCCGRPWPAVERYDA